MKLDVPYTYTAMEIPYRCRKPRPVRHEETVTVTIPEIRAEDAPVAIIEHGEVWGKRCDLVPMDHVFRLWKGRLYTDHSLWFQRLDDPKYTVKTCFDSWDNRFQDEDPEKIRRRIRREYREQFLLAGQLWIPAGEPRFVVMTFGLGHNHGGTALMIDHSYNPNIHRSRYFRIDQREAAVAAMEKVALGRGDDRSVPADPRCTFEILIPEALKLCPAREGPEGDEFCGTIENLIEGTESVGEAAWLVTAFTMKTVAADMGAVGAVAGAAKSAARNLAARR